MSKLDEFLLNPQVRTCSMAVPGTSRNTNLQSRETTGDHSSDDPYAEVGYCTHNFGQLNSPETETNPHMVTGVTEEVRSNPHMVIRVTEEVHRNPHMVAGVTEEVRCNPHSSATKVEKCLYASKKSNVWARFCHLKERPNNLTKSKNFQEV